MIEVKGAIDKETRCKHYHQPNDRIAIKFYCCGEYFSCYRCHQEYGCGKAEQWPKSKFNEKACLCGTCHSELSVTEYLKSANSCPYCRSLFNPGCALHYHLYFDKK